MLAASSAKALLKSLRREAHGFTYELELVAQHASERGAEGARRGGCFSGSAAPASAATHAPLTPSSFRPLPQPSCRRGWPLRASSGSARAGCRSPKPWRWTRRAAQSGTPSAARCARGGRSRLPAARDHGYLFVSAPCTCIPTVLP